MNSGSKIIILLLSAALIIVVAVFLWRPNGWLQQPESTPAWSTAGQPTANAPPRQEWAGQEQPVPDIDQAYLEQLIASVDREQRRQVLEDAELFRQFVRQEANNKSVLAAARTNRIDDDASIRFLMDRAANNVLREAYLNRLMQEQFPADFPTTEQTRQFYEQNPQRFQVGERLQVWQVFMPVAEDANAATRESVENQARDLAQQLRDGQVEMAAVAEQHSAHEPSRQNGGFMGAVRVADLKPDIAEVLGGLQQDEIGLARSAEGWHILRKGRTIAPEQLRFEQVEEQVRRLLINQARQEFRNAVFEEARNRYPQEGLTEDRIEEWRQQLQE